MTYTHMRGHRHTALNSKIYSYSDIMLLKSSVWCLLIQSACMLAHVCVLTMAHSKILLTK